MLNISPKRFTYDIGKQKYTYVRAHIHTHTHTHTHTLTHTDGHTKIREGEKKRGGRENKQERTRKM